MKYPFESHQGLIIVRAELSDPTGNALVNLALDTGATRTLLNFGLVVSIGYDPALAPKRYQVTTGSGVEFAPFVELERISSLGVEHREFPVLCHTLPPSAGVDGLLGLDFLRSNVVTVDFPAGTISVS